MVGSSYFPHIKIGCLMSVCTPKREKLIITICVNLSLAKVVKFAICELPYIR